MRQIRPIVLCCVCLFLSLFSSAQKQGNIWLFGDSLGLNFNSTPPSMALGATGALSAGNQFSTSCIADSSGKLLFYTDGDNVFTWTHGVMGNTYGITLSERATQGSLIVPKPGSDSLFYVFTADDQGNYNSSTGKQFGYNYSIVNMCLGVVRTTDTLGVVTAQKNVRLMDNSTEKLCGASDGNGGYWILGHQMFFDSFVAWHLTSGGITGRVATGIGPWMGIWSGYDALGARGQMKFNPAGTKVAAVSSVISGYSSTLDLFDFNPVTGRLSKHCQTLLSGNTIENLALGVEFSPDGSKVYATYTTYVSSSASNRVSYVMGFNVSDTCAYVQDSRDTLFRLARGLYSLTGIQAAPDGNLYVGCDDQLLKKSQFHRIKNPNGNASLDTGAFSFRYNSFGGVNPPSFIAGYRYHSGVCKCPKPKPASISVQNAFDYIQVIPNPADKTISITGSDPAMRSQTRLIITDATGRSVYCCGMVPAHVDVSSLPGGLYFYTVYGDKGIQKSGRFAVVH